jgi:adenylate kinase family enzyme
MHIFGQRARSSSIVLLPQSLTHAWLFRKQGSPLNLVMNLDVSDEVILSRISDRWVHLPSGRVYNLSYNRPRVDGFDDETGEPLTKRSDDKPVCADPT